MTNRQVHKTQHTHHKKDQKERSKQRTFTMSTIGNDKYFVVDFYKIIPV